MKQSQFVVVLKPKWYDIFQLLIDGLKGIETHHKPYFLLHFGISQAQFKKAHTEARGDHPCALEEGQAAPIRKLQEVRSSGLQDKAQDKRDEHLLDLQVTVLEEKKKRK